MASHFAFIILLLPTLGSVASSVAQLLCTDAKCVDDCTNYQYNINECYNSTGGGSLIFLSCDGSGVNEISFTGPSCTGQGTSSQMDVATCLQSGSTSFINTCVSGYAFTEKKPINAQPVSGPPRKTKMLSPLASSVAQLTCTDAKCVDDCKNNQWNLNECYNTTGGNSQIFLGCDDSGVHEITYTGPSCTGQGTSSQMDVAKCLQSETGTSFINTCVSGDAFTAKDRNTMSSTLLRARAFVL